MTDVRRLLQIETEDPNPMFWSKDRTNTKAMFPKLNHRSPENHQKKEEKFSNNGNSVAKLVEEQSR